MLSPPPRHALNARRSLRRRGSNSIIRRRRCSRGINQLGESANRKLRRCASGEKLNNVNMPRRRRHVRGRCDIGQISEARKSHQSRGISYLTSSELKCRIKCLLAALLLPSSRNASMAAALCGGALCRGVVGRVADSAINLDAMLRAGMTRRRISAEPRRGERVSIYGGC